MRVEAVTGNSNQWRLLSLLAAAAYVLSCSLVGFSAPGLEYDEAISMRGAMELSVRGTVTPSPASLCIGQTCVPLMVAPYVGAAKDYFLLPLFLVFEPTVPVGRFGAALIVAGGIFGIAYFVRHQFGPRPAMAAACILAIHPAAIDLPLYDNGNVAMTLFAIGLIAFCTSRFQQRRTRLSLFCVGVACGFAVWIRLNLLFLILGESLAVLIFVRPRKWPSYRHAVLFAAGAVVGTIPLLIYIAQSLPQFGHSVQAVQWNATIPQEIAYVSGLLGETLLSDGEHRGIWMGPDVPFWQLLPIQLIAVGALLACLYERQSPSPAAQVGRRAIATAPVIYLIFLLLIRMPVAEHHLLALVPFVVVSICIAPWGTLLPRPLANVLVIGMAIFYFSVSAYWNWRAREGLQTTGGTKSWSDTVIHVSGFLQGTHPRQKVKVLDWGLAQNIYFLSRARTPVTEIFWDVPASPASPYAQSEWKGIVKEGGLFLTNAQSNLHLPAATNAFLDELSKSGQHWTEKVFYEKRGGVYAVLYQVSPSQD